MPLGVFSGTSTNRTYSYFLPYPTWINVTLNEEEVVPFVILASYISSIPYTETISYLDSIFNWTLTSLTVDKYPYIFI